MFNDALPVLVRVTGCTALDVPRVWAAKVRLVAVRLTAGPMPVPVKLTDCWLLAMLLLLSVMVTVAVAVPGTVGAKVT
jgi:hypothetical protein